jgi:hypothetical protein
LWWIGVFCVETCLGPYAAKRPRFADEVEEVYRFVWVR